LETEVLVHTHTISIYDDLEGMGMGIKRLKLLRHTVEEIATANNISKDSSDVEQQYDDKLGFEAKLQNLKSEIELTISTAWLNSTILSQLEQIQQVSSFVWSVGQGRKGSESANKSVEECRYQGARHIDK